MTESKHPFDEAAEQLEAERDAQVANQAPSSDFFELMHAADESVGDYPQAGPLVEPKAWEPGDPIEDSDGRNEDGFPELPHGLDGLKLEEAALWTDVLSCHLWSDGYLLSDGALAVFEQANLGNTRTWKTTVRGHNGEERPYTYLYINENIPPTALDFERSEFYVADMLSLPLGPVEVNSFDEWLTMQEKASNGELVGEEEFSHIAYKRLYFLPGQQPTVDLFRLERLSITTYISPSLRKALNEAGITGLDIKANRRLFRG